MWEKKYFCFLIYYTMVKKKTELRDVNWIQRKKVRIARYKLRIAKYTLASLRIEVIIFVIFYSVMERKKNCTKLSELQEKIPNSVFISHIYFFTKS